MEKRSVLILKAEITWWLLTATIVFGVLYPISSSLDNYPFFQVNVIFIIVFITLTRYVFLLKHSFFAHFNFLKIILGIVSVPLIFYLIEHIIDFQIFLDEVGLESFMKYKSLSWRTSMASYIRSEMLLFGVASVIIAIIFPFRMMLSVWRQYNKGTV
ncbi:MAG TPA: hypothetical protein ENK52_07100 [Saprospiraceae bacterium]|nr:hypothetical protein [Saprospiraceae bacterium]